METSIHCLRSGWCDYSEEHRRVREEAERLIRSYVEGSAGEYWMTVVVAPYGSGKTTLLRHLADYASRELGVRSALVEFSEIVDFIVERYGSIHESQLPKVVEEYIAEKHNAGSDEVFVLLVDEIEESYDLFRGVVEHETSPLRGLAEAVRLRQTRVYPVLAFGPSSTLKEAVFGPVAWRSRVLTIPLLPKPVIRSMLQKLGEPIAELLANTIWWASKGRVAWARLLAEQTERLAETAERGPEALEALLLGDELLAREVVEGVPLFDRSGYRDVKRFVENKKLLPYLVLFTGPVPLPLLEKWLGEPIVPEAGIVYGFTRSFINADDLVSEASAWMSRLARSRGFSGHSVEHAVTILEHVASAWSLSGRLPFDPQGLRELFNAAADLAREVYGDDPGAAQLLEAVNPDLIMPDAERANSIHAYLKPSMLLRIYPTATNNPLIGCARKAGAQQVVSLVESLALEELESYSSTAVSMLGLEDLLAKYGAKLLVTPAKQLGGLVKRLCTGEKTVLVLTDTGDEAGAARLPSWLRALEDLGLVSVVRAGPRLSLFIYSLFYNYALGTQACSLERLEPRDRRLVDLYGDTLKSMVVEALHSLASPRVAEAERKLSNLIAVYGEDLVSAAAWLANKPPESLRDLDHVLRRLGEALAKLAAATGTEAPTIPPVQRLVEQVRSIAEKIPLEALSPECTSSLKQPLRLLAGGRSLETGDAGRLAGELLGAASTLPEGLGGYPRRLAGALREAAEALESLAAIAQPLLPPLEKRLRATLDPLLERISSAAQRLEETLARIEALPEPLRREAHRALQSDLARIATLDDLVAYTGRAASALAVLEAARKHSNLLSQIEARKQHILRILDEFFTTKPEAEAKAAAEAQA